MNKFSRVFVLGVAAGCVISLGSAVAYQKLAHPEHEGGKGPEVAAELKGEAATVARKKVGRRAAKDRRYRDLVVEAATKYHIDPDLLMAIIHVESHFDPDAVNASARGLMQLTLATGRRFGATDLHDPKSNVEAGARYVRYLLNRFDSNLRTVLAAYNAGEGTILNGRRLPKITRQYVVKVMDKYQEFKIASQVLQDT